MFEKLLEKIKSMVRDRPVFDPSRFNDPVAMLTQWQPASSGGANFCTHKLALRGLDRMEFRATVGARIFSLIFFFMGAAAGILIPIAALSKGGQDGRVVAVIFPLLFGGVFMAVGGGLYYSMTKPIVFDKRAGFFWKGRKAPNEVFDRNTLKYFATLEDIHALQIVSEYCSGNKSSYTSYELNLVLKDGRRVNVVDHGNAAQLRKDTAELARYLGKPVWDAA